MNSESRGEKPSRFGETEIRTGLAQPLALRESSIRCLGRQRAIPADDFGRFLAAVVAASFSW